MKRVLLLMIVMISVSAVHGQKKRRTKKTEDIDREKMMDEEMEDEDEMMDYTKYRGITLGFGPRFVNTDAGFIVTQFRDNSPAPDDLMTITEIEDGYTSAGISLGYKFGRYSGLAHDIDIDVTLGDNGGGIMLTYGLGWNFPITVANKPLLIRPSLFAGFGGFGFSVGEMENNTGFIQIGETKYSEPALDVELQSSVLVYGPAVDFVYKIADRFDIFLSAHYDIGSDNDDTKIIFTSQEDGTNQSTLSLDGENPTVLYNDEELTSLPYDISGLRLQLGVSYLWNRD